ncbi:EcsC family protein [Methylocella sp.]|uniref:EcsC family protein n=1 Tax=Methylocella sp. TaxID=1978226 RepID=UPI0035B399B9
MSLSPTQSERREVVVFAGGLSPLDEAALARAVAELSGSSVAMRLASAIGRQLGAAGLVAPPQIVAAVRSSAETAIRAALAVALRSLPPERKDRSRMHKSVVTLAGAAGGALGVAALPVELPFTTTMMLRSIAAIAQDEGEDLADPETAIACLEVFALGGEVGAETGETAGAEDMGYYAARVMLAKMVSQSARHLLHRGLVTDAAPLLTRLVSQIAARFGLVVSQKLAAQAVPLIGAASGAAINYVFVDHFQSLAHGHFTVRRLERAYGETLVRAQFERLRARA